MRTVRLDGAVEVAGAYYHVPPGLIGHRLRVQWDALHVRILCPKTGELLREHVRQAKGRRRMKAEDRPAKTPESTVRLISRACMARFRDPDNSLDGLDFAFNRMLNRKLLFELATARFVAKCEDVLLLGPPGAGKSHLVQAIGTAVIHQGHQGSTTARPTR